MPNRITKAEVLDWFRDLIGDSLRGDKIAKQQAWNDYTDSLCKDGIITNWQYNNWSNPF